MRLKRELAASLTALVVVASVAAVTLYNPPSTQASAIPEVVAQDSEELTSTWDSAQQASPEQDLASPEQLPLEPLFEKFSYGEDFFLPRPVDSEGYYKGELDAAQVDGGGIFSLPVNGRPTSPFGMRRHPVLGVYKLHTGLDLSSPCGAPVGAAADGVVSFVGWAGGNGFMVGISHGSQRGFKQVVTNYGHLASAGVRVGDKVSRHQAIGLVGTTGYSTGCHLHFEVKADGNWTDPASWLNPGRIVVATNGMLNITPGPRPADSTTPVAPPALGQQPGLLPPVANPGTTTAPAPILPPRPAPPRQGPEPSTSTTAPAPAPAPSTSQPHTEQPDPQPTPSSPNPTPSPSSSAAEVGEPETTEPPASP